MLLLRISFVTLLAGTLSSPMEQQAPPVPVPAILQNYKPVTAERLKQPEPGDWLMIRGKYDGWGTVRSIRSRRRMLHDCSRSGYSRPASPADTRLRRSSTMA
jgi:hypothetical protein